MRMFAFIVLVAMSLPVDTFADGKAGEKKSQLCLLCHKTGNVMAAAPLLEGQPAKYLVAQITAYKTGKRPEPTMRTNVANLSTRDIGDIADYFSSKSPLATAYSIDLSKAFLGEKKAADLKCATCHQATSYGGDAVPRLAGQVPGYVVQQLEAFAAGRRAHAASEMSLGAEDMENLAHYFAGLK
jgi:cytochrome c553